MSNRHNRKPPQYHRSSEEILPYTSHVVIPSIEMENYDSLIKAIRNSLRNHKDMKYNYVIDEEFTSKILISESAVFLDEAHHNSEWQHEILIEPSEIYHKKKKQDSHKPPNIAQILVCILSHPDEIAAILGDLDELYLLEVLPRVGKRQADFWYWQQAVRSMWPLLGSFLKRRIVGWIDQVFGTTNR